MQDAEYSADLDLLKDVARGAGQLAMRFFCKSIATWDKEPGHPVTEADIAVNKYLMDHLRSARPDYGWLSEETSDTPERLTCHRNFVVDPIDGTRAFMKGEPHFCIALAILEGDKTVVSVLYAPAHDELFEASFGGGARMNGQQISASERSDLQQGRLIAEPAMFKRPDWPVPWPDLVHPDLKPNSTAYRMALVADGRWDGVMVLWHKWDWDVAAATLIVEEAGGRVTTHLGNPFVFNQKIAAQQSLIAAGPLLHEQLVNRCRHVRLPKPGES